VSEAEETLERFAERFLAQHRDDPLGDVATRLLFENARVRVWSMELAPGQASDLHRHELDYLVILHEGDRIAAIPAPGRGGRAHAFEVVPGHVAFVPRGGSEWAVNVGRRTYRETLVELKERG
jgi:hypothetical protein